MEGWRIHRKWYYTLRIIVDLLDLSIISTVHEQLGDKCRLNWEWPISLARVHFIFNSALQSYKYKSQEFIKCRPESFKFESFSIFIYLLVLLKLVHALLHCTFFFHEPFSLSHLFFFFLIIKVGSVESICFEIAF